ncbi:MAG: hypothetical protein OXR66_03135 [Candidatus Woesearchaeota archaeon]|nr:hypothetical protein [Candidatus Woesearchaeota archaeon]
MRVHYEGPRVTKKVVQGIVNAIQHDYHRDSISITLGHPELEVVRGVKLPRKILEEREATFGFTSNAQLSKYVGQTVSKILRASKKQNLQVMIKKSRELRQRTLECRSGNGGMYRFDCDKIYIDAFSCAMLSFNRQGAEKLQDRGMVLDIPGILRHELVHADIGTCVIREEIRRLHREQEALAGAVHSYNAEASNAQMRNWYKSPSVQRALELADQDLDKIIPAFKKRKEEIQAIVQEEGKLDIPAGEEALAYNVFGDRDLFSEALRTELLKGDSTASERAALTFYDFMQQHVEENGVRASMGTMITAINTAYETRTHLFEVFRDLA